jgi:hypothetical protein
VFKYKTHQAFVSFLNTSGWQFLNLPLRGPQLSYSLFIRNFILTFLKTFRNYKFTVCCLWLISSVRSTTLQNLPTVSSHLIIPHPTQCIIKFLCCASILFLLVSWWGTRWRSWLRLCSTSWKVAGSIPDGVMGIFHWHNPSGRTMFLGLTQPLTEMSTRNLTWGIKAVGA